MAQERKDFLKVTEFSAAFNEWYSKASEAEITALALLRWQVRAQIIIAQQLTIVSQHLGKIVDAAEEARTRT